MSEKTKTYEGMFLLGMTGADFETTSEPVRNILARYEAEVLMLKPWDERRLAYDIRGHRRGLYALSFFKADPARLVEIEHDCQLDERILRVLILRRDRLTDEEIEREKASVAKSAGSGDRAAEDERERGGGRRRPRRGPATEISTDESTDDEFSEDTDDEDEIDNDTDDDTDDETPDTDAQESDGEA